MSALPQNVYSIESVRAIDRCAIETGVPGFDLMTRAGERLFADALDIGHAESGVHWCVVCGSGNNAGDGYVIARLALEHGLRLTLISIPDPASLSGDAAHARETFTKAGGRIHRWSESLPCDADMLIDAIFGSGICRDVDGDYRAAIDAMNAHPAAIYAVDIPSGLDGETGHVRGAAINASRTMSFVGLTPGLFLGSGQDHCGELCFDDLDIDAACVLLQAIVMRRLVAKDLQNAFPPRARTANKGMFGHVVVLGGGPGMPGAALLAGTAALRTGAGRVTLATHPEHAAVIAAATPELMSRGVRHASDLHELLERADCLLVGPGLGLGQWAEELYAVAREAATVAVWDADALNLLARDPHSSATRVLTPHPGEAARLLGVETTDIQHDRLGALNELQKRYGGTIVLKGAGTLISDTAAVPWICTDGNPGMAAPGMGDVLGGIIAACLAQGVPARLGVLLHARAGDRVAQQGERGLLASDLFPFLREGVNP